MEDVPMEGARHQPEHEALLDELRRLLERIDPVPPEMLAAAELSFALRTLDADLAALTYDSASEGDLLATVRGAPSARLLTFETPGVTVEVEVVVLGSRRRLVGQLVPGQRAAMQVRHGDGRVDAAEADHLGRFVVSDVEAGPVSVRCYLGDGPGGTAVDTDWFVA